MIHSPGVHLRGGTANEGKKRRCPGSLRLITKPRGELHAMWSAGDEPARMIEIISPAEFEGYFQELSDLIAGGAPDPSAVAALAGAVRRSFGTPDWLPDLTAGYHLKPPPGPP